MGVPAQNIGRRARQAHWRARSHKSFWALPDQ